MKISVLTKAVNRLVYVTLLDHCYETVKELSHLLSCSSCRSYPRFLVLKIRAAGAQMSFLTFSLCKSRICVTGLIGCPHSKPHVLAYKAQKNVVMLGTATPVPADAELNLDVKRYWQGLHTLMQEHLILC